MHGRDDRWAGGRGSGLPDGVAVVTIVSGRRRHLAALLAGLDRQVAAPDDVVVVSMDGAPVDTGDRPGVRVVPVPPEPDGALPLARARNAGVHATDTATVVLLDVDCIPAPGLVASYGAACSSVAGLVCGEVRYLPPGVPAAPGRWTDGELRDAAAQHPGRPHPAPGALVRDDRYELAWTTSLAMRRSTFDRVGGFDEGYRGYGAEDTDFGERARGLDVGVWWTADATAYHQHHDRPGPPRRHLHDIVRNARRFEDRHGWYPMTGWLEVFAAEGLIRYEPRDRVLEVLP